MGCHHSNLDTWIAIGCRAGGLRLIHLVGAWIISFISIASIARIAGHGFAGLVLFSVLFWICFGLIIPCYVPILPFQNRNVYCVSLYVG